MRKVLVAAGILVLGVLGWSDGSAAQSPGPAATFYEVTENIQVDQANGVIFREATLMGFAMINTPLCPAQLVTDPVAQTCTVTGVGRDTISFGTGQGSVSGTFAVVVNFPGNSPVHVPDVPILTGKFMGAIDLSPAVLSGIPLGAINTGTFTVDQTGQTLPFSATVRLPFALSSGGPAVYLGDDRQTIIPVKPSEQVLGFPTVRLEVRF